MCHFDCWTGVLNQCSQIFTVGIVCLQVQLV